MRAGGGRGGFAVVDRAADPDDPCARMATKQTERGTGSTGAVVSVELRLRRLEDDSALRWRGGGAAEIAGGGRGLFVVSNKPRHISMKILEAEGTAGLFEEIVTKDSRAPPYQDKQEMMRYLLQKWELEPGGCLMIGDTMEDADAASKTGMQFVW